MSLPFGPVPESDLVDLRARLAATRVPLLPRLPPGSEWQRGTDAGHLGALLESWCDYDWRAHEARILDLPWQAVGSGDAALHVVHQRAVSPVSPASPASPTAPAVVLLHGWPDSVLRFERVLPLLGDLNVVVPALPGFPFAPDLTRPGMTVTAMAALIAEAMQALGYERYVVSGGDVGADVAEQLAVTHPDRVAALHLTNISPLHAVFADRARLDAESLAYLETVAAWQRTEGGYIAEQSTKPHTLAPGLADSPAGLAAWIAEKLHSWSDLALPVELVLTWISAYWLTNTIGTSFAPYVEFAAPAPYVAAPTVLSAFAHDTKPGPRSFAERFVNVQEFVEHADGGHFAAWEQRALYAADVRAAVELSTRRR